MACARPVGSGFSPLDEELELLAGSLTPKQQESLARLCTQMPFERAAKMLVAITGVQVSEATARRQTLRAGQAADEVQTAHAAACQPPSRKKAGEEPCRVCRQEQERRLKRQGKQKPEQPVAQAVLSSDGAMVPLVGKGQWAEVKTLVFGVVEAKTRGKQPEDGVHVGQLSYFSRLCDAQRFGEVTQAETQRRGLLQAKQVAAVQDGALWLQGLVDLQRPDAVRILDFPHAAEYLSGIAQAIGAAGGQLAETWLSEQLHELKHYGPSAVLQGVRQLQADSPTAEGVSENLAYLEKREGQMQYPSYQAAGWPIGSGMVESANKQVMQMRLKGPGMHWARPHVNAMLALRDAECNERWQESWHELTAHRLHQRAAARVQQQQRRCAGVLRSLQVQVLLWRVRTRPPKRPSVVAPAPLSASSVLSRRPAPNHPWRRRLLAKK